MARPESRYVCQACGASSARWEGRCHVCGAWETLIETVLSGRSTTPVRRAAGARADGAAAIPQPLSGPSLEAAPRRAAGNDEIDRVLGGGLVQGSLVLLGGEPGIGKSTLVLETAGGIARATDGGTVLLASAEESPAQIRARADRLGLAAGTAGQRVSLLGETSVERIVEAADALGPSLLIVDSIQTVSTDELEGPAGSVGQVRESAARLGAYARASGVPVVLVGHVTKDGSLAGPRTLEHLVDTVLTLEGDRSGGLRLLRATKNRFGSTEEVGVLEMTAEGLRPVADPGRAFLGDGSAASPGVAVASTLEGSRPLLVEVQALVAPTRYQGPRRTTAGVDADRVALLVAILGRRCGLDVSGSDLYVSLAGGAAVAEPALDLAIALAIASSARDRVVRPATVLVGEVSLLGELRPARGLERRLREAARLGFARAVVPGVPRDGIPSVPGLEIMPSATLRDALALVLLPGPGTDGGGSRVADAVLGSAA